jgi:hypothetical protein
MKKTYMMKLKGYDLPNLPSELTVEQFDKLNLITTDNNLDNIEKWMAKFEYLGFPSELFDDMDFEELKEAIKEFNDIPAYSREFNPTIEAGGYTYEAPTVIGVKDLGLIEKAWKQESSMFAAKTLAILFKRTDLGRTEHYTPAHIKHKTNLFKSQKADIAIPYILEVVKLLTETAQQINDNTQELDGDNA